MKIDLGGPTIEIGFGDIANIIIMTKMRELELRVSKLENHAGARQTDKVVNKSEKRRDSPPPTPHKKQYWTAKREDLLRDNFYKKTDSELLQILPGFSIAEILEKAHSLGMKKKDHENPGSTANKEISKHS